MEPAGGDEGGLADAIDAAATALLSGPDAVLIPHRGENQPLQEPQIRLLEDWLGVRLFLRTSRNAVPTQAGTELLAEAGPALERLAVVSRRVQNRARARGLLHVSALPTFAMRWLIPRLPDFQRDHPGLELRIVTASTPAEQFRMDVDAVISGPYIARWNQVPAGRP